MLKDIFVSFDVSQVHSIIKELQLLGYGSSQDGILIAAALLYQSRKNSCQGDKVKVTIE